MTAAMDREQAARVYGVKQYVAVIKGAWGQKFMVFETGDSRYYLFSQLDPNGNATGLQWPVEKRRLRTDVRRMLAHGYGNAHIHAEPQRRTAPTYATEPPY